MVSARAAMEKCVQVFEMKFTLCGGFRPVGGVGGYWGALEWALCGIWR